MNKEGRIRTWNGDELQHRNQTRTLSDKKERKNQQNSSSSSDKDFVFLIDIRSFSFPYSFGSKVRSKDPKKVVKRFPLYYSGAKRMHCII